jgi:hypothetical protein
MEGMELLKLLIASTGLPEDTLEKEVLQIVEKKGLNPEQIQLEDIREIMAEYLQEVLVQAKAAY